MPIQQIVCDTIWSCSLLAAMVVRVSLEAVFRKLCLWEVASTLFCGNYADAKNVAKIALVKGWCFLSKGQELVANRRDRLRLHDMDDV